MNKTIQVIYDYSPTFLQNLMISLYGLKIYYREYGKQFEDKLCEFEESQWFSAGEIKAYQDEKLKNLISHSYHNVPYYQKVMDARKMTPADITCVEDLTRLPVLTRIDVRDNFNALLATNIKRSALIPGDTSGTTGTTLKLMYDRQICLIKTVVDWRHKRWGGLSPGDRFASFLGHSVIPTDRNRPPFSRLNRALNNLLFSCFHMTEENLAMYVEELERFNPKAVEGYPSTVYIIARFLLSQNRTIPVTAVFTSSETLYDYQREAIEKAFACHVFDYYGMAERVVFATECEAHEGNHLNMDFGITELVKEDGNNATAGDVGHIVATSLHNYGMPLIRYQTSDVSALKGHECPCGRKFHLLENVTTKAEDIITTRCGRYVSPSVLNYPFNPMHKVAEVQYIQEDLDHLTIKLVRLPTFEDSDVQLILDEMKVRIGPEMKIKVEFVDDIRRTKSGKFRCVISKVPLKL